MEDQSRNSGFLGNGNIMLYMLLNPDVQIYKRKIYTILDLLGDVGGLLDALRAFGSVAVMIFFHLCGNPVHHYLLEAIYKQNDKTRNVP